MGFHGIPFKAFQGNTAGPVGYFSETSAVHGTTSGAFCPDVVGSSGNSWHLLGVPRGTTEVMGQTQGIEEGSDP